ncbi:MAG: MarR family winged helix-turn-helix transcriptional regulator [Oscillospiraceae bacterium]
MAQTTPNGLLIKQIHDRLEKRSNNSLRAQDLTMMQVSVLMTLHDTENRQLSMKELERHFGVAQSTVAGIISRLEQKGFVEALGDVTDKRIKLVHITPAGEVCCAEAAHQMNEAEETLLRGLSAEERTLLNALLTRVAQNVE